MNWKVRVKNPYFWVGLIAMFFCAIGVDASTFTTWPALLEQLEELVKNPYMLVTVIIALMGYVQDPTTAGFKDSAQALTYSKPKK